MHRNCGKMRPPYESCAVLHLPLSICSNFERRVEITRVRQKSDVICLDLFSVVFYARKNNSV